MRFPTPPRAARYAGGRDAVLPGARHGRRAPAVLPGGRHGLDRAPSRGDTRAHGPRLGGGAAPPAGRRSRRRARVRGLPGHRPAARVAARRGQPGGQPGPRAPAEVAGPGPGRGGWRVGAHGLQGVPGRDDALRREDRHHRRLGPRRSGRDLPLDRRRLRGRRRRAGRRAAGQGDRVPQGHRRQRGGLVQRRPARGARPHGAPQQVAPGGAERAGRNLRADGRAGLRASRARRAAPRCRCPRAGPASAGSSRTSSGTPWSRA